MAYSILPDIEASCRSRVTEQPWSDRADSLSLDDGSYQTEGWAAPERVSLVPLP